MARGKRREGQKTISVQACPRSLGAKTKLLNANELELVEKIRSFLSPDLLRGQWKEPNAQGHPMAGHCYVATEALYHLLGGANAGWQAKVLSFADDITWAPGKLTHWWLENKDGRFIDATADQFKTTPPYNRGRHAAFVTNAALGDSPSARTLKLINRLRSAKKQAANGVSKSG